MSLYDCIRKNPYLDDADFEEISAIAEKYERDGMPKKQAVAKAVEAAIQDELKEYENIYQHVIEKGGELPTPKEMRQQYEPKEYEAPKPKRRAGYGKKNKIIKDDDAEKARQLLRSKLGQLNSGIDPDMMNAGIRLALFHIEAGARSFADYSKAMMEDMGEYAGKIKPYLKSFYEAARNWPGMDTEGMSTPEEVNAYVAGEPSNLEPDSGIGGTEVPGAEANVPNERGGDTGTAGGATEATRAGGVSVKSNIRLPADTAASGREQGHSELVDETGRTRLDEGAAGRGDGERSRTDSEPRVSPDRRGAEEAERAASADAQDVKKRLAAQKKANQAGTAVVTADLANVQETVPALLPEQMEDVVAVEKRLFLDKEQGMLLTNGTGTGKTFSGLGAIRRSVSQGKDRILIIAPNDSVIESWTEAGKIFGLDITRLKDVKDKGEGVVISTYANVGDNDALVQDDWDMVVADEAHKLMSNKDAKPTAALATLWALTGHNNGVYTYTKKRHPEDYRRMVELRKEIKALNNADTRQARDKAAQLEPEYQRLVSRYNRRAGEYEELLRAKWGAGSTKSLFLSATPFAWEKNIKWAEGYLFHYDTIPESEAMGYNAGGGFERFMMQHFGYRMRYNKLTEPEPEVNRGIMQRQFNQMLRDSGALRGRKLYSEHDYSREFVAVDDLIGHRIDEGMEYLRNQASNDNLSIEVQMEFENLYKQASSNFKYHQQIRLLEAIKAKHVIPRARKHIELGRKVIVFHSRIQGGGFHPFKFKSIDNNDARIAVDQFNADFPDLESLDLGSIKRPIDLFKEEFGDSIVFYNGTLSKKEKVEAPKKFNDDNSGVNVIMVQDDAGREGISLHDTTGMHQRVLINLGLPIKPTQTVQIEGRAYRVGQMSNAVFEYLNTGTLFERRAFAEQIASRADAAENLAMGNEARGLLDSFVDAFEDPTNADPSSEQGVGGKERDQRMETESEFEQAKSHYFANQKKTQRTKAAEGTDYFATPEPVGLKMTEWANIRAGDTAMEPSAGHGAIARYFPEHSRNTFIEPSSELNARLSLRSRGAKVEQKLFEDHALSNKYDAIVMNPPFGNGGKTAIEHVAKAMNHLKDGGRIVALLPEGGMADKRLDALLYGKDGDAESEINELKKKVKAGLIKQGEADRRIAQLTKFYKVGDVSLPAGAFKRAGTNVKTHIVIIDRFDGDPAKLPQSRNLEIQAEDINELFDQVEHIGFDPRAIPEEQEARAASNTEDFGEDPVEYLATKGLIVSESETKNGTKVWEVSGKTFNYKRILGKGGLGGKWYGPKKAWSFTEDPTVALAEKVRQMAQNNISEENGLYSGYGTPSSLQSAEEGGDAETTQLSFDLEHAPKVRPDAASANHFLTQYAAVPVGEVKAAFTRYGSPEKVAHVFASIRKKAEENFVALVLDIAHRPLAVLHHSIGTIDGASVYPGLLAGQAAGIPDAAQIWLAHNHPSGNLEPSGADRKITHAIAQAFDGSGIEISGHIIVGNGGKARHFDNTSDYGIINVRPGIRSKPIKIMSRKLVKRPESLKVIDSPHSAARVIEEIPEANALLLLNNRHGIIGTLALSVGEMASIRENGTALRILRALHDTNAAAAIIKSESRLAAQNLASYLNQKKEIRVLDAFIKDPMEGLISSAQRGLDIEGTQSTFMSRGNKPAEVLSKDEIVSVVERAAPNLVQHKGQKVTDGLTDYGGFLIADTFDNLPDKAKEEALAQNAGDGQVEGALHNGRIYLVADMMGSEFVVERTLFHEATHAGLRNTVKELYQDRSVLRAANKLYDAIGGSYGLDKLIRQFGIDISEYKAGVNSKDENGKPNFSKAQRNFILIEELAAHVGEIKRPGVKARFRELIGAIRAWFRRHGWFGLSNEHLNASDIAHLVKQARRAGLQKTAKGEGGTRLMVAWHGSPHMGIEKFSTEKIGSGSGNTAYGWGLYFAGSKEVGLHYKENLATKQILINGKPVPLSSPNRSLYLEAYARGIDGTKRLYGPDSKEAKILDKLKGAEISVKEKDGALYQVDLKPREEEYLLWDDPLSKQSDIVKNVARTILKEYGYLNPEDNGPRQLTSAWKAFILERGGMADSDSGSTLYHALAEVEGSEGASKYLLAMGVRGTKYLDGTSRRKNRGSYNYVIFEDSDVEVVAALSRKRNHTPEQKKALEKIGLGEPESFSEKMKRHTTKVFNAIGNDRNDYIDAFKQGALDKFYGIKKLEQRTLGNLPADASPYVAARLSTGISSVMRAILTHGQPQWASNTQHLEKKPDTQGLLDVLAPVSAEIDDWMAWMIGNRAARLKQEGREKLLDDGDIKALQALGEGREDRFRQVAVEFAAFKRSILDVAEQAGLIDPESRKVWDNADWIPFYRKTEENTLGPRGGQSLANKSSGIRVLRGGTSRLNDPLENIIMNFHALLDASLKNNAARKAIEIAPDVVEQVGLDFKPRIMPNSEVKRILVESGTDPDLVDSLPPNVLKGMSKIWSMEPPKDDDVIRVMEGGKAKYYRVKDPMLLKSLTSFEGFDFSKSEAMNKVIEASRLAKRVLTASVTANPAFQLRNFIRDTASTAIISRHPTDAMAAFKGAVKAYRESGAAEHMLFAGASFASGYVEGTDKEATARAIRRDLRRRGYNSIAVNGFTTTLVDSMGKYWENYRRISESIENANREAVFEATMRNTSSITAAAYEAKDLMDFSLRGSWHSYQLMADVIPFFNARVQGMYRLGRTNPGQLAIRGGLMLMAPTLLLALANMDDDRYKELPDWDKDTYWHFWVDGHHFRIPKPFEVGVIFATIPERAVNTLFGDDDAKKFGKRLAWNIGEQMNLFSLPQIIKPLAEVAYNHDKFRDRAIDTQADEAKFPHERYNERTSATMRELVGAMGPVADLMNLSPKKAEHLVYGYFGTMGIWALSALDVGTRMAFDYPDKPAMRPDQIPLLRVLYRGGAGTEPFSTQYISDIYEAAEEFRQIQSSYRLMYQNGEDEKAAEFLQKHEKELMVLGPMAKAAAALGKYSKQIDMVMRDRELTPEEKRTEINELLKERNERVREVVEMSKEAAGQN